MLLFTLQPTGKLTTDEMIEDAVLPPKPELQQFLDIRTVNFLIKSSLSKKRSILCVNCVSNLFCFLSRDAQNKRLEKINCMKELQHSGSSTIDQNLK